MKHVLYRKAVLIHNVSSFSIRSKNKQILRRPYFEKYGLRVRVEGEGTSVVRAEGEGRGEGTSVVRVEVRVPRW
jgi:hypothetical protein